jgi:hypothetical protein
VKLLFFAIVSAALLLFFGLLVFANRFQAPAAIALTVPQNDLAIPAQSLEKATPAPLSATPVAQKTPGPQVSVTPPLAACDPRASVSISPPRPVPAR